MLARNIILYVFVIFSITFAACNAALGDFKVKAPPGWVVFDSLTRYHGREFITYPDIKSDTPLFVENARVSIHPSYFARVFMYGVMRNLKKQAAYFQEEESGTRKINGYTVHWVRILLKIKEGELCEQEGYYFGEAGNVYLFVYTTRPGELRKYRKEIDGMLNSFRIL